MTKEVKRSVSVLGLFAVLITLSTYSGFLKLPTIFNMAIILLFVLYSLLVKSGGVVIKSVLLLGFMIICVTSILINNPPYYFRAWDRLAMFSLLIIAYAPLITSKQLEINRIVLFRMFLWIMTLYAVGSFIAYFFGINFFIREGEVYDYTEAGHFSGLTHHSMSLGPVAAISSIFSIVKALSNNERKKRIIWFAVAFSSFAAMMLAASRGAVGGFVLAVLLIVLKMGEKKAGKMVRNLGILIIIVAAMYPVLGQLSESVRAKNEYGQSQGGIMYSREAKMAARVYEIQHNFITGVGFATVDETVDAVDRTTGTIEPNSSWLGVFSMTGVIGFILFAAVFLSSIRIAMKKIGDKYMSLLLTGIMAFYFVHMMIEGYALAAGSYNCTMYWLTVGVIHAYKNENFNYILE